MVLQSAFVFIKPHANKPKMQELVKAKFAEKGITIKETGTITGEEIDANKFIDQHYYAIASKATILQPAQLNVPADKFKDTFGEEWETVKAEERVFNALDIAKKLGWTPDELDDYWNKTSDKASPKTRVKFGGGFYCGKIEVDGKFYYTFNAFFMTMRGKFTTPGTSITYFVVEFDDQTLAWADFRGKVLGPTDPAAAPSDSLRGLCFSTWKDLGLESEPNTGDNAVHASASPFEGLAERTNWLASKFEVEDTNGKQDPFAKLMVAKGITPEMIKAWSVDPQVVLVKGEPKTGSLFDQVEDMDCDACLDKLKALADAQ